MDINELVGSEWLNVREGTTHKLLDICESNIDVFGHKTTKYIKAMFKDLNTRLDGYVNIYFEYEYDSLVFHSLVKEPRWECRLFEMKKIN